MTIVNYDTPPSGVKVCRHTEVWRLFVADE